MPSQLSSKWYSDSEAQRLKGLFIPLSAHAILTKIRDPGHRKTFIDGLVSMNEDEDNSQAYIIEFYKYLPKEHVPGYDPDYSGETAANQGRSRNNGCQQAGDGSDPISQQFSQFGLSGNLYPIPYLPLTRANVLRNGRPSEQHGQSLLPWSELGQQLRSLPVPLISSWFLLQSL